MAWPQAPAGDLAARPAASSSARDPSVHRHLPSSLYRPPARPLSAPPAAQGGGGGAHTLAASSLARSRRRGACRPPRSSSSAAAWRVGRTLPAGCRGAARRRRGSAGAGSRAAARVPPPGRTLPTPRVAPAPLPPAGLAAVGTAKNMGAIVPVFDTRAAVAEQVRARLRLRLRLCVLYVVCRGGVLRAGVPRLLAGAAAAALVGLGRVPGRAPHPRWRLRRLASPVHPPSLSRAPPPPPPLLRPARCRPSRWAPSS